MISLDKAIQFGKVAALLSITVAALTFACMTVQLISTVDKITNDIHLVAYNTSIAAYSADIQLNNIGSELVVVGQHTNKMLLEAGLTGKEARLAAKSQREFWDSEVPRLAAKSEKILQRTDDVLSETQTTVHKAGDGIDLASKSIANTSDVTNTQLVKVGDSLTVAGTTMSKAGNALDSASKVINSPDVTSILHSTAGMAEHGNGIMASLDKKAHDLANPTFWGTVRDFSFLTLTSIAKGTELYTNLH